MRRSTGSNVSPMIGIDTNIIIRLLTRDDERQHDLARGLFSRASSRDPLGVNIVTLTETAWVLESRMKLQPEKARPLLAALVDSVEILLLSEVRMPDPFAMLESRHRGWTDVVVSAINRENGCDFTYTFDRRAAQSVAGMELLS